MQYNLTINLFPYRTISDGIDLYFSDKPLNGQRITKKWIPTDLDVPVDQEGNTFWSLDEVSNSRKVHFEFFKKDDEPKNRKYFLKHVFTQLLYKHFRQAAFIVGKSYVGDVRVLIPDKNRQTNNEFQVYDKYSLRIDLEMFGKGSGVFLSYEGQTFISISPLKQIQLPDHNLIGKVVLNNRIYSKHQDDYPRVLDDCRIVYNLRIERALGVSINRSYIQSNKYRDYYDKVILFYKQYLSGKSIGNCFEVLVSGLTPISDSAISSIDEECNLLEFKDHIRNVNVYDGLKRAGGPYSSPNLSNLQFLFVFMETDKEYANSLYSYLNKGLKNFPGLMKYVSVPFEVDFAKSLKLQKEQAIIKEVSNWLSHTVFDSDKKYFVLYISPINKNEENEDRSVIYFQMKELLLEKDISSQVIYKDNLGKDAFNFYLPNIAVAILAKLGGIPWRLPYPLKKDLIIGIGAERSIDTGSNLIGTAICFRNDGQFEEFKVFPSDDIKQLGESLKNSIREFSEISDGCNRLIIHYYKALGSEERTILDSVMKQLNVDVPYVFVTVNDTESKDYVVFDEDFDGRMPISGTIVRLRFNEFLLCNNTRYGSLTGQKLMGYPFPVKVKITSQPRELTHDFVTVKEILNQVYEFSRIYWKSIRQRNKPVTIEYSEIIAKVVSKFENKKLPDSRTATRSLWFL